LSTPLRILFAGSGEFGRPTLQRLLELGHDVVHVYTQPDKPAGRGHILTPTPIGKFALDRHLPLMRTADINAEPLPPADALVVIAFGQKIAPHVVDHARLGAINLHASRLPRYRGAAPINWAVINNDPTTGNSVIRLAQRMDAGAVLAMSEIPIGPTDTAGDIHDRLSQDGAPLVERVLNELAAGTNKPIEQDHTLATKAIKLSRELSLLDFTRDATAVSAQIRGMSPWPGCRVQLTDASGKHIDKLTLVRCRAIESVAVNTSPGQLDRSLHVLCGKGAVELLEVHPDGKRGLPFSDYANGRRLTGGEKLVPVAG
jgi:methionyl-tRNA formyltransferase